MAKMKILGPGDEKPEIISIGEKSPSDILTSNNIAPVVESVEEDIFENDLTKEFISGESGQIEDAVEEILNTQNDSVKDFGKFLEGGYRLGTLLKLNETDVAQAPGSETLELYGSESPRKYTSYKKVPFYTYNITKEPYSEGQVRSYEYALETYLLPDSIKPSVDDLVIGSVGDKDVIFKINDVKTSKGNKKIFGIEGISYKEYTKEERYKLEKSIESKVYFILDHYGTEKQLLMPQYDVEMSTKLRSIRSGLVDAWMNLVWQGNINTIVDVTDPTNVVYNKYLNYFIEKYNLLQDTAYDRIKMAFYLMKDEYVFKQTYNHTPYECLVSGDATYLYKHPYTTEKPLADPFNETFLLFMRGRIQSVEKGSVNPGAPYHMLPPSLLLKMERNQMYSDGELLLLGQPKSPRRVIYQLIMEYFTAREVTPLGTVYNSIFDMEKLVEFSRIPFASIMSREEFIQLMPYVFYILKYEEDYITHVKRH